MPKALNEITHDAVELPRHERLTLARILLDLDTPGTGEDVDAAWDTEIRARLASGVVRAMLLSALSASPLLQPCNAKHSFSAQSSRDEVLNFGTRAKFAVGRTRAVVLLSAHDAQATDSRPRRGVAG